jgi:hypothetical protein
MPARPGAIVRLFEFFQRVRLPILLQQHVPELSQKAERSARA